MSVELLTKVNQRDSSSAVSGEAHIIGEDEANWVFLVEDPETVASVVVSGTPAGGGSFTRVTGSPAAGQYRVDATTAYKGGVEFNVADAGIAITVAYDGLGSTLWARDLNRVHANMEDLYFNVMAYGAKGDGTTDDQAAVEAALADMADGDTLFFPGGKTYVIDAIDLSTHGHADMQILGGPGAVIKKKTSAAGGTWGNTNTEHVFYDKSSTGGTDGLRVRNLEFDLTKASGTLGHTVSAFQLVRINDILFEDCYFHDGIEEGLKLYKCQDVTIRTCRFEDINNNGIQIHCPASGEGYSGGRADQPWKRISVTDCKFIRIDDGLAGAADGQGVTFNSNDTVGTCENAVVTDCYFEDCIRGIWTEFNTTNAEATGFRFSNNVVNGGISFGIGCVGVSHFTIENNVIIDVGDVTSVSDETGIYVSGNTAPQPRSEYGRVANNVVRDTRGTAYMEYGIALRNCDYVTCHGNQVSGFTEAEVWYDTVATGSFRDYEPARGMSVTGTLTVNQSHTTTATWEEVLFDAESVKTWALGASAPGTEHEIHDTVTNPGRFIAPFDGEFEIDVQLAFASNATGWRGVRVRKWDSGHTTSVIAGQTTTQAVNGDETSIHCKTTFGLTKGEHLVVMAYQNSGAALNILGNVERTRVTFRKVGAASA